MRGVPLALVAVLLTSVLAGCTNSPTEAPEDDEEPKGPSVRMSPETYYLSEDMSLVKQAPEEEGSVAAGDFVATWATGSGEHPLFEQPVGDIENLRWVSAQNATVTLYLTTEHPVLPAEGALPDVAVWAGSGHHVPLVGSTKLDGPLQPGEIVEVSFDLPGPETQPPILALQGISLMTTVTMTQSEEHDVRILTGGDHASRVELETRPFEAGEFLPAEEELPENRFSGTVPLFDRVVGEAGEEVNYVEHEIEVPQNATLFVLLVQAVGGYTVDMDIQLRDASGQSVTWGVTPYPREQIWLIGQALEPYQGQTLTLRIANHLGVLMDYEGVYLIS